MKLRRRPFGRAGLVLLLPLALAAVTAPAAAASPLTPGFVREWGGGGTAPGQFNGPAGIATDGSQTYVSDRINNRVQKFAYGGKFLQFLGSAAPGFSHPFGVALDSAGDVYVSNDGANSIDEFTSTGAFVRAWGGPGSGPGQFSAPGGVATDGAGDVYVADTGNNRIQKFTAAGVFVQAWGTKGTVPGQFQDLFGVATDKAGDVYVADSLNNRVQKFTGAGALLQVWGGPGSGPGLFKLPLGIAVDGYGSVYVADEGNNRVEQFTAGGAFLQAWGTKGTGAGQFDNPVAVAVHSSPPFSIVHGTTIYVTDGSNRVQEFFEGTSSIICTACS